MKNSQIQTAENWNDDCIFYSQGICNHGHSESVINKRWYNLECSAALWIKQSPKIIVQVLFFFFVFAQT